MADVEKRKRSEMRMENQAGDRSYRRLEPDKDIDSTSSESKNHWGTWSDIYFLSVTLASPQRMACKNMPCFHTWLTGEEDKTQRPQAHSWLPSWLCDTPQSLTVTWEVVF